MDLGRFLVSAAVMVVCLGMGFRDARMAAGLLLSGNAEGGAKAASAAFYIILAALTVAA